MLALSACGGGGDTANTAKNEAPACTTPTDSIIGNSLERFIVTRKVEPLRFLLPLGTPENTPEGGQYPLYTLNRRFHVWPPEAQQKEAINLARARGTFPTLVLMYHGMSDMPDGRKSTEFSGFYVDRINDGTKVERTAVYFDCHAAEGKKYVAADEPPPAGGAPESAPAPARSGGGY
jgi:hypothetical protein